MAGGRVPASPLDSLARQTPLGFRCGLGQDEPGAPVGQSSKSSWRGGKILSLQLRLWGPRSHSLPEQEASVCWLCFPGASVLLLWDHSAVREPKLSFFHASVRTTAVCKM